MMLTMYISETAMAPAFVLLVLAFVVYAIVYMLGRLLQVQALESWVKKEGVHSFVTAIFVAMVVSLVLGADYMATQFLISMGEGVNFNDKVLDAMEGALVDAQSAGIQSEAHFIPAQVLLQVIYNKLELKFNFLYTSFASTKTISTVTKFFPEKRVGKAGDLAVVSGIKVMDFMIHNISSLMEYMFYGFLFIYMQQGLLILVKQIFFYMFPAGLALRAFPFTRSIGSFLIAISLGMFFVYPTFYGLLLILNQHELNIDDSQIEKALETTQLMYASDSMTLFTATYLRMSMLHMKEHLGDTVTQKMARDFNSYFAGYIRKSIPILSGMSMPFIISAAGFRYAFFAKLAGMSALVAVLSKASGFTDIGEMFSYIEFVLKTMILYPLIAFTITYTFIHQFATLLQANISELGRGLIRII